MDLNPRPLEDREVHIWFRSLDSAGVEAPAVLPYLSADERQRAQRFHYDQHRNEFILSRGTLRLVLASYLGESPDQLRFEYARHGKPALAEAYSAHRLSFNLSHTYGMMLLAVVRQRSIGVDIEKIRCDFDVRQIAERFFSAPEQSGLRNVRDEEQHEVFFRCWTRKEAYIKAKGEGLSLPLRDFDVSLEPDSAALVATRPDENEARHWRMLNLQIAPGYAAAAAIAADSACEFAVRVEEVRNF
jgi:4'-phosphopantetheinyl transferase